MMWAEANVLDRAGCSHFATEKKSQSTEEPVTSIKTNKCCSQDRHFNKNTNKQYLYGHVFALHSRCANTRQLFLEEKKSINCDSAAGTVA